MIELKGQTLIFSDIHCGLSGNKVSRLNICIKVIKEILNNIDLYNIKNVIFAGDWYHNRSTLDSNTINISLKLVEAIAKKCNFYMIVGNHDAYLKNSTDINSLNMFKSMKNVFIIDKPEIIILNNQKTLLVPWLTNITEFEKNSFDIMIGHFEISSKYLMQSYIEEHTQKQKTDNNTLSKIFDNNQYKSNDMVGSFVEAVKHNGYIFAGHIHKRKEFITKNRNFIFIGAPYHQNIGDCDNTCGFYILDEKNNKKFIEITTVPKHLRIHISELLSKNFDFSKLSNNIIQKVYDIEITHEQDIEINNNISKVIPYEELLPDYEVKLINDGKDVGNKSLEIIRKSKIDYIRTYINNIEDSILAEKNINKEKLFEIMEDFYKKVTV